MSTSDLSASQRSLSPFETFRESMIVLAIADGTTSAACEKEPHDEDEETSDKHMEDLQSEMQNVRERFTKALMIQLLVFDFDPATSTTPLPADAIKVPPLEQSRSTTIRTIMCDISASFLAEMATLARSVQDLPLVESPGGVHNQPAPFISRVRPSFESLRASSYSANYSRSSSPTRSVTNGQGARTERSSTPPLGEIDVEGGSLPGTLESSDTGDAHANDDLRKIASEPQNSMSASKSVGNDRKTAQSGSLAAAVERNRLRSRIRQTLIIGSLYMQAGRWPDAFRELVEGTTRAKASGDHLWHAKGLENIVVTILLQAWAGLEFHIPQICLPNAEKTPRQRASSISNITLGITGTSSAPPEEATKFKALQNLSALLPDILNMILDVYGRAADTPGESLPPYSYCETVIRFAHLLAIQHRSGGILNRKALQNIVLDVPIRSAVDSTAQSWMSSPSKRVVSTMLFKGYPPKSNSSMSLHEVVSVHAGIAAVLSLLGLQRKRAIVMKEILALLIPGLIQARKVGAAEVGIHPAAGLAALQSLNLDDMAGMGSDSTKGGFAGLLMTLCRTYGINISAVDISGVQQNGSLPSEQDENTSDNEREIELVLQSIRKDSTFLLFGGLGLKADVLRLCANFSESLPNFKLVMAFTSALLKATGSHSAAKSTRQGNHVIMPREEQTRLVNKLVRTLEVVRPDSAFQVEASYWDRFLVRGVRIGDASASRALIKHTRAEVKRFSRNRAASIAQGVGPFIHNALSKATRSGQTENVLVAGDQSEFVVLLQNVYDFNLVIEDISFKTEGSTLRSKRQAFVIGPRCLGEIIIAGTVSDPGELRIIGCRVKVQGCRLDEFLIVSEAWKPVPDVKVKHNGLLPSPSSKRRSTISTAQISLIEEASSRFVDPRYDIVAIPVLETQPLLSLVSTTLSQSMLAVLDGETRRFSIQVRNVGESIAVNFLHVSFENTALANVGVVDQSHLSLAERYDNEHEAIYRQSFQWLRPDKEDDDLINAGATSTILVEVLGHLKLSESLVKIDYANLGYHPDEAKGNFFTRQLSLPFVVTVNASIRIRNIELLPFKYAVRANQSMTNVDEDETSANKGFMLLLDLENEWVRPLNVLIRSDEALSLTSGIRSPKKELAEVLQPHQLVRLALPMSKLYVENPHSPIPSLNPGRQKQFIFDADHNVEDDRAETELFWYREELLNRLSGTWQEVDSDRTGYIDMRVIKLDQDMLDIVRRTAVKIDVEVGETNKETSGARPSETQNFNVAANGFITLKAVVRNDGSRKIRPVVRFQPVLSGQALDESSAVYRIAWTGLLNQPVQALDPGESATAMLSLLFASAGLYEVKISVHALSEKEQSDERVVRVAGPAEAWPLLGVTQCTIMVEDE